MQGPRPEDVPQRLGADARRVRQVCSRLCPGAFPPLPVPTAPHPPTAPEPAPPLPPAVLPAALREPVAPPEVAGPKVVPAPPRFGTAAGSGRIATVSLPRGRWGILILLSLKLFLLTRNHSNLGLSNRLLFNRGKGLVGWWVWSWGLVWALVRSA